MKTYLLTYHWALPVNILDSLDKAGVSEWMQLWPGMVLFKGNENQNYYAEKINEQNKNGLFLVTEYDQRRSFGWLPPKVWEWVKPINPLLTRTPDELAQSLGEHHR
jgi:hypothetical protein